MTETRTIDLDLSNPSFSGPLALLLDLIERRRLPITQVSLAEVADQYLERMHALVGLDADILADFLVVGARLLLIKSRALLPSEPRAQEEEDVAADLEQRLLEYRIFKEAAEKLRELEESGRRSYPRQAPPDIGATPEPPLAPTPPSALASAMARMLKALEPHPDTLSITPRATVEQRIAHILDRLSRGGTGSFSHLAGHTVDQIVATFLAILELMRRGILVAEQQSAFGEIRLSLAPTAS